MANDTTAVRRRVKWHVVLATTCFGGSITLVSPAVRANCAMPTTYDVEVHANTVTICPLNYDGRGCPDAHGMLREDRLGRVVKLADDCTSGGRDGGTDGCYVDRCVPKGTYKYGFAEPYECCTYCCGTDYYSTATVDVDPQASCGIENGGQGGEAGRAGEGGSGDASLVAPWGDSPFLCNYMGSGGSVSRAGAGGSGAQGGSAGIGEESGNAGAATGGSAGASSESSCSCRVPGRSDARGLVFAANGALVVLGLRLRRRRHASRT